MRYELWEDQDALSFFPEHGEEWRKLLSPAARLIWACNAQSWDEAQALKHEHLGWAPYKPL
ncbi:hypothetical protein NYO99_19025 [Pelomonas sp. UHG3]|uniref:Uncharacterized protein n=1 Tax=Roseateles hydrophilus TaxID=2975054 RepID=A0ACC6CFG6_9BURK|nr:hypothetical protein [Pelomonas sp. UHG3]MCY4747074.1 hypothetical protein [Pelomonas sp. UHG3]